MDSTNRLPYVFLRVDSAGDESQTRRAQLIDRSENSVDLKSKTAFEPGVNLLLWGKAFGTANNGSGKHRVVVRLCKRFDVDSFRINCIAADTETRSGSDDRDSSGGDRAGDDQDTSDYYEILQISPRADDETIHRVYRFMAQRYHPDNADTGDAARFAEVLLAYRMLSDPEKRSAYDLSRQSSLQSLQEALSLDLPDGGPAA